MIAAIVIALGLVVLTAAWSGYRSFLQSFIPLPTPAVRNILEARRLLEKNPEAARALIEPLIRAAASDCATLRARADTDPAAAATLRATVNAVVTHVERELRKVRGRDEDVTAQLTLQLATLRDELAWVQAPAASTSVAVPAGTVIVGQRPVSPPERPMALWYRLGSAVIGSLCLAFSLIAVTALVRGARHPAIFFTALSMLFAAVDFLMAAFNVKGHRPTLLWFVPGR